MQFTKGLVNNTVLFSFDRVIIVVYTGTPSVIIFFLPLMVSELCQIIYLVKPTEVML